MSQPRSGVRQTLKKAGTQFTHIFRKDENVAKTDTNRSTDGKPTLSDTPAQDVASTPKSSTNARPDSSGTELGHVPTLPPTQLGTTAAPDPQIQKDKSSNDADASDPVTTAGDPGALPNVGTIASAKASITLTSASATAETEKTTTIDGAEVVGTPNVDTTTPVTAINDVATGGHSTTSWTSKRTPLWNEAIGKWKETPKGQAECKEVESLMADASSKSIETAGFLSQLQPEAQSSSKWRLRLKRCEPIINATRGIAVTLANTDPHKVAPLIVHSVFAGINILFNRMTPENTDKVLDILFGCSDIIRECVTFELYFTQKNNPVVEDDMNAIRKALPVLYLRALRLMYEIQSSCKSVEHHYENSREKWLDWIKTRGLALWREFSDKIAQWESEEKKIKIQTGKWARLKKTMDEKLKADKDIMEVRGWVRDKDDPEPTLNSLKKRVMPEGRYGNAAQWFLGSVQFLDWCETFQNPESQETRPESPDRSSTSGTPPMNAQPSVTEQPPTVITSTTDDSPAATTQVHRPPDPGSANDAEDVQNTARRVLWLRGGYKTGKTTAMYHTYVALESSADFQLVDKKLRVVPYFCDASSTDQTNQTRPKYETIIRGLLWHMSLSPDFILAEPVQDLYNVYHSTRASKKEPEIEDWETLFKNLVSDQQYHYSFLVDALDECISPKEVGGFLKFMSIVLKSHPNTSLLCSSHAQVNVSRFFGADNRYFGQDTLEVVDVTAEESADDMRYFIQHELERRKVEAKRSIFYNPQQQGLLTDLEDALMRHAQGNFRWVQIWLDILLPNDDDDDMQTIRSEEVAKTRLRQLEYDASYEHDDYQQLEAGYRRLWDLNRLTDADELGLRTRLFHIILASRWAQTPETLSATLRIRESSYSDFPLPEDVERMSSNFLIRTQTWSGGEQFRFVDEAAKRFILSMDSGDTNAAEETKNKLFSDCKNHESIAEMYIQLIGSAFHPYWRHAGFEPSKWKDLLSGNGNAERLLLDIQRWRIQRSDQLSAPHFYLSQFGLRHCAEAAEKRSVYDPLWVKVIEKLVFNPNSAFAFIALAEEELEPAELFMVLTDSLATWVMWGQEDGRLRLLHSHVLALLNISHSDDSPRFEKALQEVKAAPAHLQESYEYRLFKDAACIGGAISAPQEYASNVEHHEATALQIACRRHNTAAVEMILEVSSTLTHIPADHILRTDTASFPFPICMSVALRDGPFNVARALLVYEKKLDGITQGESDDNNDLLNSPFISKQWSLVDRKEKDPALLIGACHHRGDRLLDLLRIASPEDINLRGLQDWTALHFAAGVGNDVVVRGLVEEFGADVDPKNAEGRTPASYAKSNRHRRALEYLKQRGADIDISDDEGVYYYDGLLDAIYAEQGYT